MEISRSPRAARCGVPHDAGLVRRLPRGPPAAAEQLSPGRPRRAGADAEAAHPRRAVAHLRRRARPHRLADRLDGDGDPQRPSRWRSAARVTVLTDAVRNLCGSDPSGDCPQVVTTAPVLPPPSGETPRHARRRRPARRRAHQPAVGRHPARPGTDQPRGHDLRPGRLPRGRGARGRATRTFLIPQAEAAAALRDHRDVRRVRHAAPGRGFVVRISQRHGDLREARPRRRGAAARSSRAKGYRESEWGLWRLDSEIDKDSSVGSWMGVARVGRYVAQVNFTPAGRQRHRRGHLPGPRHPGPRPSLRAGRP